MSSPEEPVCIKTTEQLTAHILKGRNVQFDYDRLIRDAEENGIPCSPGIVDREADYRDKPDGIFDGVLTPEAVEQIKASPYYIELKPFDAVEHQDTLTSSEHELLARYAVQLNVIPNSATRMRVLGEYTAYKQQARDAAMKRFATLHSIAGALQRHAERPYEKMNVEELKERLMEADAAEREMYAAAVRANQSAPLCGQEEIRPESFKRDWS